MGKRIAVLVIVAGCGGGDFVAASEPAPVVVVGRSSRAAPIRQAGAVSLLGGVRG